MTMTENNLSGQTKINCRWSFEPIFDCIYGGAKDGEDQCYTVCGYRRLKMKEHYESSPKYRIYPEHDWEDREVIGGNGKWTCACGQPNFFETINIYDNVVCSLCAKEYALSQSTYLRPLYDSSNTTITEGEKNE